MKLITLYKTYIQNTSPKAVVEKRNILFCYLTFAVQRGIKITDPKIYISTKIIKHLYDRKPAEEFDAIIKYLPKVVRFPDKIYENKKSKRGQIVFVKKVSNLLYLASIEKEAIIQMDGNSEKVNQLVTCFRIRRESYLRDYKLIWSWKGGEPSS